MNEAHKKARKTGGFVIKTYNRKNYWRNGGHVKPWRRINMSSQTPYLGSLYSLPQYLAVYRGWQQIGIRFNAKFLLIDVQGR